MYVQNLKFITCNILYYMYANLKPIYGLTDMCNYNNEQPRHHRCPLPASLETQSPNKPSRTSFTWRDPFSGAFLLHRIIGRDFGRPRMGRRLLFLPCDPRTTWDFRVYHRVLFVPLSFKKQVERSENERDNDHRNPPRQPARARGHARRRLCVLRRDSRIAFDAGAAAATRDDCLVLLMIFFCRHSF